MSGPFWLGASSLLLLAGGGMLFLYKRKLEISYEKTEKILRDILNRKTVDYKETLSDTREDKLASLSLQLAGRLVHASRESDREKEAVKGMIGDISHQLKTPLSNIKMCTELLEDPSLEERERLEFLHRIREQSEKIQWLLSQLVKISRLETGAISFAAGYEGLKQTIADSVASVFGAAEEKQIEIRVGEFPDLLVWHNRKWTVEALGNILENAVKYSPRDSAIDISIRPLELYVDIEIRDEGPGIGKEEFNLIFQRFYRGRNGEKTQGSGLGLYLTQLILSKEKGYVTVDSKPGEGSSFHVMLPIQFLQDSHNFSS